ncbi:extracellular solute-binding protein [Streptomyces albipurpureus]|uniref:Extracellular solute-binding protein n=1 Tax=Streptomyces albipurpureus TaxID=2897419 RepID=A0ABT0UG01_9ACTN|nr:extracellular solute-binding protein [Streptomyces sp. CWNU-1]MCM2387553.1 extracellular solute-binding protein [Streptomyces sp. CWNU-1]
MTTSSSWLRRPGRVRAAAATLGLLLAVTACTGSDPSRPAASPNALGSDTEIVVVSGLDVTGQGGIRHQLVREWNAREKKAGSPYRARLVELPGSADQQRSQLLGALQSGSASYDVVNLDITWIPEFAEGGLIQRLDASMLDEKDLFPAVAATARWNDTVYSVPFNTDVGLLYYRKDHLVAARLVDPADTSFTWKNLIDYADAIERAALRAPDESVLGSVESGWTSQLARYEGLTVNGVEALATTRSAPAITDAEGRYSGNADLLEDGLEELARRTHRGHTLPAASESSEQASLADFMVGRTSFLRHWPSIYRDVADLRGADVGVMPLPGKAVLGGQNLALAGTVGGRAADKARTLISFLTSRSGERCLLDAGFAATRRSAYNDPDVTCTYVDTPGMASPGASPSGEPAQTMPRDEDGRPAYASGVLQEALKHAVSRPRTPYYGAFTQTYASHLAAVVDGSPPDSLAAAARELDADLREAMPVADPED